MGVVVNVMVLSAALGTAPAPVSAPSWSSGVDPWPVVGAGAVLVGGAVSTSAAIVAIGQQAVIDDPAAVGADRQRAIQQVPFAIGLVVAGAVVVVAGVGVIVWRTFFAAPTISEAPP